MKLSRYIVEAIHKEGASHVFLIPGGYVDNFIPELVNLEGITPIVSASESGAAMMADGFARASGTFGVCMGIGGPGASNMMTGLSLSLADQNPVLALIGETPISWRGRDAIQDSGSEGLKTFDMLKNCVRKQFEVHDTQLAQHYIHRAIRGMYGIEKGPVSLSVPLDKQNEEHCGDYQTLLTSQQIHRPADISALMQCLELLEECPNTVILAGSGVNSSLAHKALLDFAEHFSIPVASTMAAKGCFPENHPLSLGILGWAGSGWANESLLTDDIDCLIVLGSRLGQVNSFAWTNKLVSNRKLIQIDLNPENLNRTYIADQAVQADIKTSLEYLCRLNADNQSISKILSVAPVRRDWLNRVKSTHNQYYDLQNTYSNLDPIHPAQAIQELCEVMPKTTQVVVDNGAHTFFASHYWQSIFPNSYFSSIKLSGAMGWGIPAAIGVKLARPEYPVVAVVGDGCMLMEGVEIQTAARYQLNNFIVLVLNNKAHGNPKLRAENHNADASVLTDIQDHNWAQFAEALGASGFTVHSPKELLMTYEKARESKGPVLIDVKCGLYATPTKVFDETFMQQFSQHTNPSLQVENEQR